MVTINFPTDTVDIIDGIRGAIGRLIEFTYIVTVSGCSLCTLDPVTNTSADSFCVSCSGVYWVPTYSGVTISGHIFWNSANELQWPTGGKYFDGDCRVQIKYDDSNWEIVKKTEFITIDEVKVIVNNFSKRGVPDLNRIILYCDQEDKDDE